MLIDRERIYYSKLTKEKNTHPATSPRFTTSFIRKAEWPRAAKTGFPSAVHSPVPQQLELDQAKASSQQFHPVFPAEWEASSWGTFYYLLDALAEARLEPQVPGVKLVWDMVVPSGGWACCAAKLITHPASSIRVTPLAGNGRIFLYNSTINI